MVWSFWAADARSEWVAWLRRTAALLPRPRGGQQRCVEGGSSREVVLQRVRPAGRRALMSCLQLLTWSPVLGASGSAGHRGRVPALWVHHDDEGAWRACAKLCGSSPSVNLYTQESVPFTSPPIRELVKSVEPVLTWSTIAVCPPSCTSN